MVRDQPHSDTAATVHGNAPGGTVPGVRVERHPGDRPRGGLQACDQFGKLDLRIPGMGPPTAVHDPCAGHFGVQSQPQPRGCGRFGGWYGGGGVIAGCRHVVGSVSRFSQNRPLPGIAGSGELLAWETTSTHEGGFWDLVDGPLLVAVLDPAGVAAGADRDRIQAEGDRDQGRSAQRAAWHQRAYLGSAAGWAASTRTAGGRSVGVGAGCLGCRSLDGGRCGGSRSDGRLDRWRRDGYGG
jgi:hypothetical protein